MTRPSALTGGGPGCAPHGNRHGGAGPEPSKPEVTVGRVATKVDELAWVIANAVVREWDRSHNNILLHRLIEVRIRDALAALTQPPPVKRKPAKRSSKARTKP